MVEQFEPSERLYRAVYPPNIMPMASQNLLEKVGFVKEGEMREYELCRGELIDITLWGILRRNINAIN